MSLSDFQLLTKADAAAIFGVCTKTIDNYIREKRLPPPVPFASREYWHPADFRAFLDDTFRRGKSAAIGDAPPPNDGTKEVGAAQPARLSKVALSDSSPVVRQQRRQQAKLRQLNTDE